MIFGPERLNIHNTLLTFDQKEKKTRKEKKLNRTRRVEDSAAGESFQKSELSWIANIKRKDQGEWQLKAHVVEVVKAPNSATISRGFCPRNCTQGSTGLLIDGRLRGRNNNFLHFCAQLVEFDNDCFFPHLADFLGKCKWLFLECETFRCIFTLFACVV